MSTNVNWVTADGCVVRSHRRIRRQSSRIHVHTADADATRQNSFVSSASAVCIGLKALFQDETRWTCALSAWIFIFTYLQFALVLSVTVK